jgi:hypothetical protein
MDATTYTATGTTPQTVTNAGSFKPDLVWTKNRTSAGNHYLNDSVRGAANALNSNTTSAEASLPNYITSFNSNGYGIGSDNFTSGQNIVGWQWQAGQGSTSSNTSGSITSTVSVNATAGFSVVTWTGNGTAGATVGHGLGVAPSWVIIKNRTATGGEQWLVWHKSISQAIHTSSVITLNGYTGALLLNGTGASISYGFDAQINGSTNGMLAYCWSEIAGFSKFGSFTANNSSNGNFIYLGFRPRWIMTKQTSGSGGAWFILDTARNTFNVMNNILDANTSGAERNDNIWDATANGMKLRIALSGDFIYAAFAENPFKNANAR